MPEPITELLVERGQTHGDWVYQALVSQQIKFLFRDTSNWSDLTEGQREAMEMFAVKLSRILSGNPDEPDHWRDIAGYATLVAERLGK